MTRIRHTISGIVCLILSVTGAYYFFSTEHQPEFAPGTNVRVFLPENGSNQKIRYERYFPDHRTRSQTDIEYQDGSSEKVLYSQDNIRLSSTKYFPQEDGAVTVTKSTATYDSRRGLLYTSHKVYRADGSLERSGALLADGRYQSQYFFAENHALARERIFDKERKFVSETLFAPDGAITARISQSSNPDERNVVLYWPSGAQLATYSINLVGGVNGNFYAEDGTTIVSEFSKSYWSVSETYFNASGKPWQIRIGYSNNLSIRIFNDDGKVVSQQVWRLRPATSDKPAYKMLGSVSLFRPGVLRPYRTITMDRTGQYVETVATVDSGKTVTKTLDPSGHVVTIQKAEINGYYNGPPRDADEAKEVVDPALLAEPFNHPLPELQDRNAPPMEYDYE